MYGEILVLGMSTFENFGERNFRIFINGKNIEMS